MNKALAIAAATLTSLTLGTAFAQDAMSNEVSAGAAAAPTTSTLQRDQVVKEMHQGSPDAMANETAAGATSGPTTSMTTREKVRAALQQAMHGPSNQMALERAAWG